jgi:hypothetical protein
MKLLLCSPDCGNESRFQRFTIGEFISPGASPQAGDDWASSTLNTYSPPGLYSARLLVLPAAFSLKIARRLNAGPRNGLQANSRRGRKNRLRPSGTGDQTATFAFSHFSATHSARNAIIGSMRLARRAGIQQARNAMLNKSKATRVNVIGSDALTP